MTDWKKYDKKYIRKPIKYKVDEYEIIKKLYGNHPMVEGKKISESAFLKMKTLLDVDLVIQQPNVIQESVYDKKAYEFLRSISNNYNQHLKILNQLNLVNKIDVNDDFTALLEFKTLVNQLINRLNDNKG